MKKKPVLYGIIGLLAGILIAGIFGSYAVNYNNRGMMGVMGVDSSRVMGGDIDRRFIEQMIPHHEDAIAMAKLAKERSKHDEVKALAENIITSQSAEIVTMKQWYKDWYGTNVPTVTSDNLWGGHMMNSQTSTSSLIAASDFDKAFLSEMISHHQMAVMMANMLSVATNRSEMKKLASDISSTQTKEINDISSWQQQWGYVNSFDNSDGMMNMMGH